MNKEIYESTIRTQFKMINELSEKIERAIFYIQEHIKEGEYLDSTEVKYLLEILSKGAELEVV